MKSELISVVLPIYNVEKYIETSIDSVVNQTYKNLEIILVDDGSPDNCPEICDKWAEKDNRIKVIHKENAGLGMARNSGLENATGDYICFFDSDDFVAPDTIEKAYSCIKEHSSDIVCFGFSSVDSNGEIVSSRIPTTPENVFEGDKLKNEFLPNLIYSLPSDNWNLNMSSCMAMFSMELIKKVNWRFVSEREILSEDVYSLIALYKDVNKVAVLSEALYFYRENNNSLSRVYRPDRFEKNKICYEKTASLCRRLGHCRECENRVGLLFLTNAISAMKHISVSQMSFRDKQKEIKKIIDNHTLQIALCTLKTEKDSRNRRILFFLMKNKLYLFCYILCSLKT